MDEYGEIKQISRDPFARLDVVRRVVRSDNTCAWCGQKGKFQYGMWPDDGKPHFNKKMFCSVDCYRMYYS